MIFVYILIGLALGAGLGAGAVILFGISGRQEARVSAPYLPAPEKVLSRDQRLALRECLQSEGWNTYMRHFFAMWREKQGNALGELYRADREEFLQWSGYIQALRDVSILPEMLLAEDEDKILEVMTQDPVDRMEALRNGRRED